MKKLSQLLPAAIAPACRKNNFLQHKIILEWEDIVGKRLANISVPIKTKFLNTKESNGQLVIGIYNPAYVLELKMMEKTILNRLSIYFGYSAINKLKLIHLESRKR